MITTIINKSKLTYLSSHIVTVFFFFFFLRTSTIYPLREFQVYNSVLLTIVMVLYIVISRTYSFGTNETLYSLINTLCPPTPTLVTTGLFCASMNLATQILHMGEIMWCLSFLSWLILCNVLQSHPYCHKLQDFLLC